MSHTMSMMCPMCDSEIEIEYEGGHDEQTLLTVLGSCIHAHAWGLSLMPEGDKYEYEKKIWQGIEDYWVDRKEAEMEARWEARGER